MKNNNKNNMKNSNRSSNQSNTMNYVFLAIFIIIITFIYLYRHRIFMIDNKKESYTLIDDMEIVDNDFGHKIRIHDTRKEYSPIVFDYGNGLRFAIKFEIYISSTNESKGWEGTYNNYKTIFKFGDSVYVSYNPKTSNLKTEIRYKNSSYYDQWKSIDTFIPLQKWLNIKLTIDNRIINLFIDDNLHKTIQMPNVPLLTQNSKEFILIGEKGSNIQGKIKKMVIEYN